MDVGLAYKSFFSRISMSINYIMWSSNLFFLWIQLFPALSIVQVFQGPGFSGSRFFWVQVFQGPGFSGSRFFWVQVLQGPGFSGSWSRVWVQILEVVDLSEVYSEHFFFFYNIFITKNKLILLILFKTSRLACCIFTSNVY